MPEELLKLLLLALLGIVAGFLNITAGGGSLLTLPFLIFLGLPATVANGSNRIAILIQNLFAAARFHRFKVIPKGVIWVACLPAVAGSLLGAQLALEIDEMLFKRLLAVIMVAVMALNFFGPGRREPLADPEFSARKKTVLAIAFFAIGIYGGFIQGGIGFLIIAALTLVGYDLVKTNALKVLVVLVFTPFALGIFIYNGEVDYLLGSVLAVGNGIGGWLATRVVVEKGHRFVRWIVMAAVIGFAVKLLVDA